MMEPIKAGTSLWMLLVFSRPSFSPCRFCRSLFAGNNHVSRTRIVSSCTLTRPYILDLRSMYDDGVSDTRCPLLCSYCKHVHLPFVASFITALSTFLHISFLWHSAVSSPVSGVCVCVCVCVCALPQSSMHTKSRLLRPLSCRRSHVETLRHPFVRSSVRLTSTTSAFGCSFVRSSVRPSVRSFVRLTSTTSTTSTTFF